MFYRGFPTNRNLVLDSKRPDFQTFKSGADDRRKRKNDVFGKPDEQGGNR